jgi:hypothetical protein
MSNFGCSGFVREACVDGGLIRPGDGELDVCDRFVLLIDGSSPEITVSGGEGCEMARERLGAMTPRSPKFRLFLRVCMVDMIRSVD